MRNYIFISIVLLFLTGCNKDKFKSTPELKLKDVNTTELHREQLLRFTFEFTDKEGDISDSIFIKKTVPGCEATSFTQAFQVPVVPESANLKGEIQLTLGYNVTGYYDVLGPQCSQNDTATFRFALKDKKGNISDTVTSPPIIIYQ